MLYLTPNGDWLLKNEEGLYKKIYFGIACVLLS